MVVSERIKNQGEGESMQLLSSSHAGDSAVTTVIIES